MKSQRRIAFAVAAVTLLAAILFSFLGGTNGWYEPNSALSSFLVILWVFAALAFFRYFEFLAHHREEMVRRFYVSPEWVYNHEYGYFPLESVVGDSLYSFVMAVVEGLLKMSYDLKIADAPSDFKPIYIVECKVFEYHFIDDEEGEGTGAGEDERGVVIDAWRGTVKRIDYDEDGTSSTTVIGKYSNVTELTMLLDINGILNSRKSAVKEGEAGRFL